MSTKPRPKKIIRRTPNEVRNLWIDALNSGEYKQGKAHLKRLRLGDTVPTYCCMGVLMDLAAKDGGAQWVDKYPTNSDAVCYIADVAGGNTMPPEPVCNWLRDEIGVHPRMLAHMNDDMGLTFKQIASYIRQAFWTQPTNSTKKGAKL